MLGKFWIENVGAVCQIVAIYHVNAFFSLVDKPPLPEATEAISKKSETELKFLKLKENCNSRAN